MMAIKSRLTRQSWIFFHFSKMKQDYVHTFAKRHQTRIHSRLNKNSTQQELILAVSIILSLIGAHFPSFIRITANNI